MDDAESELPDYQEDEEENYEAEGVDDEADVVGGEEEQLLEMQNELDKLNQMSKQVGRQITSVAENLDENSIYVGQVDYEATPEELRAHFGPCGTINRITIMVDKFTGQPKGFAYIEFADKESVENAIKLDDTPFKGRQLKVTPKRQNVPASALRGGRGGGRGRGAPFRGRGGGRFGRGRGAFRGRGVAGRAFRGGRGRGAYYSGYY